MSILLNNVGVDSTSESIKGDGGRVLVIIRADDYGGGSVSLEIASVSDPNGQGSERYAPLSIGAITSDDNIVIDNLPVGTFLRAAFSGSSGASNVFVEVIK